MSGAKPLTGEQLRQKVRELSKEMPPVSPKEMARRCGYYTVTSDQEVFVNEMEFYTALLNTSAASPPPPVDIAQIPQTEEGAVDINSLEYLRAMEELRQRQQLGEGAFERRVNPTEEP